jgi:hypothetical protein
MEREKIEDFQTTLARAKEQAKLQHLMAAERKLLEDDAKRHHVTSYNAVKLEDLPEIKRRSLLTELRRQKPDILTRSGMTYWISDLINPDQAMRGRPYWNEFISEYQKIII